MLTRNKLTCRIHIVQKGNDYNLRRPPPPPTMQPVYRGGGVILYWLTLQRGNVFPHCMLFKTKCKQIRKLQEIKKGNKVLFQQQNH